MTPWTIARQALCPWGFSRHSGFFMVQLSHLYMTTGKTIALTIQTFVSKVMSLLFKKLSRFVIAFFPRSKRLLTSWLCSPSTLILKPKKIKSVTVSTFYPSICHEVIPNITFPSSYDLPSSPLKCQITTSNILFCL